MFGLPSPAPYRVPAHRMPDPIEKRGVPQEDAPLNRAWETRYLSSVIWPECVWLPACIR